MWARAVHQRRTGEDDKMAIGEKSEYKWVTIETCFGYITVPVVAKNATVQPKEVQGGLEEMVAEPDFVDRDCNSRIGNPYGDGRSDT
jgi:hypothetical protein